jgi:hypothetical protein
MRRTIQDRRRDDTRRESIVRGGGGETGAADSSTVAAAVETNATAPAEPPTVPPPVVFQIRTPNLRFKGQRAGVTFADGVGRTSDPAAADACRAMGYTVESL